MPGCAPLPCGTITQPGAAGLVITVLRPSPPGSRLSSATWGGRTGREAEQMGLQAFVPVVAGVVIALAALTVRSGWIGGGLVGQELGDRGIGVVLPGGLGQLLMGDDPGVRVGRDVRPVPVAAVNAWPSRGPRL